MKKIMFLLAVTLISFSFVNQESTPKTRAERKIERKLAKEKMEEEMIINTEKAIMTGHFVLKADQIRNKYGSSVMVNSTTNFVAVKGRDVYVQFGTETGIGYNGIGGLTMRGSVNEYELTRDKEYGGYSLLLTTSGSFGTLTISMHSNITGDIAEARVSSNWGSQLIFRGEVVPVVGSQIYKGTETN